MYRYIGNWHCRNVAVIVLVIGFIGDKDEVTKEAPIQKNIY